MRLEPLRMKIAWTSAAPCVPISTSAFCTASTSDLKPRLPKTRASHEIAGDARDSLRCVRSLAAASNSGRRGGAPPRCAASARHSSRARETQRARQREGHAMSLLQQRCPPVLTEVAGADRAIAQSVARQTTERLVARHHTRRGICRRASFQSNAAVGIRRRRSAFLFHTLARAFQSSGLDAC